MTRLELEVGAYGHGGITVGHAPDGRAVLVRHALPGERVSVSVTERRSSYWRADVVEVLEASPHRVTPPCPHAGPGRCGGCDLQHVDIAEQRRLKAAVVAEQLRRIAGLEVDVTCQAVPGDDTGLGWRTRMRFAGRADGRLGLRRHRSHVVEPLTTCLIADPRIDAPGLLADRHAGPGEELAVAVDSDGRLAIGDGDTRLVERAAGRTWHVAGDGFWQVHRGAADVLARAVVAAAGARPGDRVLDLYAGVGLFAGALLDAVDDLDVTAVEVAAPATECAEENLPAGAVVVTADVEQWLHDGERVADVVVLDPPRRGAGRAVVDGIAATGARTVVHVACDPASLARAVALLAGHGYRLATVDAFDLFPMTHHVECVARLDRTAGPV